MVMKLLRPEYCCMNCSSEVIMLAYSAGEIEPEVSKMTPMSKFSQIPTKSGLVADGLTDTEA